jgi:uncharacterized protein (TIGR02145 family)
MLNVFKSSFWVILFIGVISSTMLYGQKAKNTKNTRKTKETKSSIIAKSGNIKIGTQNWMSKNLDVSTFRNGDPILEITTASEWKSAGEKKNPAYCYFEFDESNGKKYGKLYNWYALNDSRGLAPEGYHIPSDAEWTILTDYLGGEKIAGFKMKSKDGWQNNGNGDNSSRFNGLPGGYRYGNGTFENIGEDGYWWSSTKFGYDAFARYLYCYTSPVYRYQTSKEKGFSVVCLRD